MNHEEIVSALQQSAEFGQLAPTVLSVAAERMDVVSLEAGMTLFEYGDLGDALYFVLAGRLRVMIPMSGTSLTAVGDIIPFERRSGLPRPDDRLANAVAVPSSKVGRDSTSSAHHVNPPSHRCTRRDRADAENPRRSPAPDRACARCLWCAGMEELQSNRRSWLRGGKRAD